MEVKREVKCYSTNLYCDNCGGLMLPTGQAFMSNPPMYPHECKDCGGRLNIRSERYPRITYEEILTPMEQYNSQQRVEEVLTTIRDNKNVVARILCGS